MLRVNASNVLIHRNDLSRFLSDFGKSMNVLRESYRYDQNDKLFGTLHNSIRRSKNNNDYVTITIENEHENYMDFVTVYGWKERSVCWVYAMKIFLSICRGFGYERRKVKAT